MTNSQYNIVLLELFEEMIEKPLASLDYDQSLEEVIGIVDECIGGYVLASKKLVEYYLTQAYLEGVLDVTLKLNGVMERSDVEFEPLVPDRPEKLDRLIGMQQRNVEDYALVLRGRLRSAIENYFYLD